MTSTEVLYWGAAFICFESLALIIVLITLWCFKIPYKSEYTIMLLCLWFIFVIITLGITCSRWIDSEKAERSVAVEEAK